MAVNLSPIGGVAAQFLDNSGNPLSGGKIFTYAAGTTTPQATYTSSNGATPHANPIILDAAGRVPSGEIWLTDGLQYKFLIKTSTDTQIGSYDNIIGINSNFVNYTSSQEIQTATAGQTVFTLTTMQYQPGTNSLSVFVDGVNQYGPGALYAYVETSSTVVTFTSGLHVGAEVKFTTTAINSSAATDAEQVGYIPPFTGSVPTNVELKLAQTVSVKDFGAVGDGVVNDAPAIQAALDYAKSISGVRVYFPAGTYRCDAQLSLTSADGVMLSGENRAILRTGGSIINYTGTASPFITITGTSCGLEGLNIYYTSLSFAGTLVKISSYASVIDKCFLSGEGVKNNGLYLLDLDTIVDISVSNTFFGGSQYAVRGRDNSGLTEANVVSFNNCTFNGQTTTCVINLGQAWSFNGCTFQQVTDLTGSAIDMAAACFARGTSITGCWFGDATAAGAWAWVKWQGSGLSVTGCYINGTGFKTADAIRIIGTSDSVSITGNHITAFLSGVNIGSSLLTGSSILGNLVSNSTNKISGVAATNVLTNYTGAWTPTFTNLTTTGTVTLSGFYQKTGDFVRFTAYVQPSGGGTSAAASATITNLPFTSASSPNGYDICSVFDVNTPLSVGQGAIGANSTVCGLPNWMASTSTFVISGSYTSFQLK